MLPFAPAAIRSGQKTSKNTCSLPMFNRRTMNNPEKKSKGVLETVHQTKQMKQKNQPQPTIFFWGGETVHMPNNNKKDPAKKTPFNLRVVPCVWVVISLFNRLPKPKRPTWESMVIITISKIMINGD